MRKPCVGVMVSVIVGAFFVVKASAQSPPAPQNPPKEEKLELNTVLMDCTFELEGRTAHGEATIGTGFVIGRPILSTPGKARYVLITAAHVLDEMAGDGAILHLRRKLGENTWIHAPVPMPIRANGQPLWIRHPAADVAVMYISLPSELSLPLLSTDFLADDAVLSRLEIHPGDELECLGYPLGNASNEAGFPILRSGKIASYPLLPTGVTKTFLFDFRVFKGNSGGPVYFVQLSRLYGNTVHLGETVAFIAGLVSEERLLSGPYEQVQLSLAVVVHASLIKQAIEMLPAP
jgi:hypothetical protein